MSAATGGEAYYAKNWRDERQAFSLIREDLAHLYFLSYYPQTNPNRGWRTITVKLKDPKMEEIPHSDTQRVPPDSCPRYRGRGFSRAINTGWGPVFYKTGRVPDRIQLHFFCVPRILSFSTVGIPRILP